MPSNIRVLIADDHDFLRAGLVQFLATCEGIEVIGAVSNGSEAVEQCGNLQPQVVLMDIVMPVMDGITATRIIRQKYPHIKIVILTLSQENPRKREALEAGASRCLHKGVSVKEISDALRDVVQ
jgi:two-component system, NarL family, response regulator LiaR